MKKLNNVASLFVGAAFALAASGAFAQNWVNSTGIPWKNGSNELCWRSGSWSPSNALESCDGAPVKAPAVVAPPPAPVAPVAPVVAVPVPKPIVVVPPAPTSEKVTFAADTFFDFDKAVLKTEAKGKLDDLLAKIADVNVEVIVAIGHTDSVGSDSYNQTLSLARSEAVKAYFTSKGVESNRVYTEGKGEKEPVADNKTKEGREKNRRVEIEVVGTRAKK